MTSVGRWASFFEKEKDRHFKIRSILGKVKRRTEASKMAIGETSNGTFEPVVKQKAAGGTKVLRIAAAGAAIVFALTAVDHLSVSLTISCQYVLTFFTHHSRLWP